MHFQRALFLVTILSPLAPSAAAPPGTAGPLVGHVTSNSAALWMCVPAEARCTVSYRPEGQNLPADEATFSLLANPAGKAQGHPTAVTLRNLADNTTYRYTITLDGRGDPDWQGSFTTPPAPGTPHKFRMVLTSCMKFGQPQGSWNHVLAEKPHLHLTVGDTHYADTTDPSTQWGHHLRYRRVPEFARVIRNVPTYSMWDDHDYGPNDSDGTAAGKENSLAGWKQFWRNPGAGTPETPGAFYSFTRGEVDFFVVDGRYHRSPDRAPDDNEKRMLGDAQFQWLLDGLKASRARFKVIASGSTLNHSKSDGWRIYTFSRHRLFDSLRKHRIPGVVYMSGDIHNSLFWEHPESERVGYPLVEVISSGVANSQNRSFATIDFDTITDDPTMRVRIIQGNHKISAEKTWRLSQLSHK